MRDERERMRERARFLDFQYSLIDGLRLRFIPAKGKEKKRDRERERERERERKRENEVHLT